MAPLKSLCTEQTEQRSGLHWKEGAPASQPASQSGWIFMAVFMTAYGLRWDVTEVVGRWGVGGVVGGGQVTVWLYLPRRGFCRTASPLEGWCKRARTPRTAVLCPWGSAPRWPPAGGTSPRVRRGAKANQINSTWPRQESKVLFVRVCASVDIGSCTLAPRAPTHYELLADVLWAIFPFAFHSFQLLFSPSRLKKERLCLICFLLFCFFCSIFPDDGSICALIEPEASAAARQAELPQELKWEERDRGKAGSGGSRKGLNGEPSKAAELNQRLQLLTFFKFFRISDDKLQQPWSWDDGGGGGGGGSSRGVTHLW